MKAEQKFLVELLGNTSETTEFPDENFDWLSFLETAQKHRVIPAIFQKLQNSQLNLPTGIFEKLHGHAQKTQMQNLELDAQLLDLARIFELNEIEFIVYKGAILAQIAYGDSSARQFGDLDVLIRKKDFPKVKKIICENGGAAAWKLTAKQEKAVLKYYYEYPFLCGENEVLTEVHWQLVESFFAFDFQPEELFERAQTVSFYGKNFRTLANEDLLIYLCVHGSKHFWQRLSWICDVGQLVQNQPIDWQTIRERAARLGSARMLESGLFLASDLLKIDLPPEIQIIDRKIFALANEIKKQIFSEETLGESARVKMHLKMRERRLDRLKYARRLLFVKLRDSLLMPMGRPE